MSQYYVEPFFIDVYMDIVFTLASHCYIFLI